MNNFIAEGTTLPYTVAGTAIVSGAARTIGSITGVAKTAGAVGDDIALQIVGVVEYDKQAALAIAHGVKVYHDSAADEVDTTNTNDFMGYAWEAALAGDAKVKVLLARLGD